MKNKSKPLQNALLFFMRITLINILITSISIVFGYAIDTKGQEVLNQKLTLQLENAEVKNILTEIEKQVDVKFTYRPRIIKDHEKQTLNVSDASLNEVLTQVLGSGISYEVIGKQIILQAEELEGEFSSPSDKSGIKSVVVAVSGIVTDEGDVALPGVNVLVKGTNLGTTTDVNGRYALEITDQTSVLVFSFIGYMTQEVEVGNRTTIDVKMTLDVQSLEEVVVVGYGEQKKVTVTGAVVEVEGAELQKSPAIDLSNSFAGRLAGVVAVQTSGEPGYDASTIRIRGVNSIGNAEPLVVIDGIPDRDGGLNRLSPQDIENISVLKDASSAIYGSRAANGVILITTKRGKSGKPTITYDFNQGWAQPTRTPEMSNAVEYANIMNEIPIYKSIPSGEWAQAWQSIQQTGTYTSTGGTTINANYSPSAVAKHADHSDPWGYPDTDWFDDALKTWSPQQRHNLQITGGSENIKYMTSLGYIYQDAIYKNSATFYKQYNFRINMDIKISKYLDANFGIMAREEDRNFPTETAGEIFRMLMRGRPTEPEVWPNGLPGPDIENGQNPYVITTNATGYEKNPKDYLQTNGSLVITNPWVAGLKLTLMGAVDKTLEKNKRWETPWYLYTWDRVSYESDGVTPKLTKALRSTFTDPRLTQSNAEILNTNLTALLNYDKTAGDHYFGILVGVTREEFKGNYISSYRREYISTAIDQPFFGGPTQLISGGNDNRNTYHRARLGYYGRVNYNYQEKYLAEFLWRYDGSSYFPEDSRFGFFPGILVGWNIANEPFFSNVSFVNRLKIRASYGQMGNDLIYDPSFPLTDERPLEYAYLSLYDPNSYPINSQVSTTLEEGKVANPNYTWEVSNNSNIGVDAVLFGNKIDFAFEYFFNKRKQMLIFQTGSTPFSTGIANRLPPVNEGIMENKGYDFTVGYNGEVSDLTFRIGFNAGYNKNEVIFMDEPQGAPEYQWQTGHPWNAFLAYKSDGVFLNEEEIAGETLDYSGVTTKLMPGDMKFVDTNNDGVINADDKVRLDNTNVPNFNYGITLNFQYKNFDLSILFQGATGALLRFGTESGDIGNYVKWSHDHRWSIDNPSSTDPRLAIRNDTYYTGGEYSANTYNLFKKDYLRLKNVELGYNFPVSMVNKIWLSNLRLYVNGLNLVTWDKYKIFDPEADNTSLQYYPQSRVINFGVRVTF